MTEFTAIYSGTSQPAGDWAREREAEGWDGVAVPDHLWVLGQPVPHVWVTMTAMAVATTRVRIASTFANNLMRSPVEFAHAALTLNALSGGRVDAGLGAGWDEREAAALGLPYPDGAERSQRLGEAVTIAGALFREGRCTFNGCHYSVDIATIGPRTDPPPRLVASATGRTTMRRVIDHIDVLELQAPGFSMPGKGSLDATTVASVRLDDLRRAVDDARVLRPDVMLGTFIPFGCGEDKVVSAVRRRVEGSPFERCFGDPADVAGAVHDLASLGFERIQLGAVTATSHALLAPHLGP